MPTAFMERMPMRRFLLYENLWRNGFMVSGLAVAALAALFNGISQFWYLYSPRKIDFYHSLPVKRSRMFWYKSLQSLLYFLLPYLVIGISTRYKTIPVVIQMLVGTNGNKDLGALMAMLVLSIVPIVIFYMACQKYIIEGVVAGAVKG